MNETRTRQALAGALALALMLGGCGGGKSNRCDNPAAPGCVVVVTSPSPTPAPTPTPTPAALDVSGGWRSQARGWNFRLEQSGTTLRGAVTGFKNVTYPDLTDPVLQISGSISQDGAVAFTAPVFAIDFSGTVDTSGLQMTGTLFDCANGCRNYGEVLDKQ